NRSAAWHAWELRGPRLRSVPERPNRPRGLVGRTRVLLPRRVRGAPSGRGATPLAVDAPGPAPLAPGTPADAVANVARSVAGAPPRRRKRARRSRRRPQPRRLGRHRRRALRPRLRGGALAGRSDRAGNSRYGGFAPFRRIRRSRLPALARARGR